MKTIRILRGLAAPPLPRSGAFATGMAIAFMAVALWLAAAFLSGCSTHVTRTITTDKNGTVTDTMTTSKGLDPEALKLAEVVAAVYVPRRAPLVREEKSGRVNVELLMRWSDGLSFNPNSPALQP